MLGLSVLSIFFTLPHTIEDFLYDVPRIRFGVDPYFALFVVAAVYVWQALGLVLSARDMRPGHVLNLLLALGWFLAVALDHSGDILFRSPYRSGALSKGLEVGATVVSLLWAIAAVASLVRHKERRYENWGPR